MAGGSLSAYGESLVGDERKRYLDKISLISDVDLYWPYSRIGHLIS
jgi:hypothetical protein